MSRPLWRTRLSDKESARPPNCAPTGPLTNLYFPTSPPSPTSPMAAPTILRQAESAAATALLLLLLLALSSLAGFGWAARSEKEIRQRFYGDLPVDPGPSDSDEGSIAKIFNRVLEKEFSEADQPEGLLSCFVSFRCCFLCWWSCRICEVYPVLVFIDLLLLF